MNKKLGTRLITAWAIVMLTLFVTGCPEDDVGIVCSDPSEIGNLGENAVTITSNSTECLSRICLKLGSDKARCTMICESDDDCPESDDQCGGGYRCVVARENGPLACCKVCLCADNLTPDQKEGKVASKCTNASPNCPKI